MEQVVQPEKKNKDEITVWLTFLRKPCAYEMTSETCNPVSMRKL